MKRLSRFGIPLSAAPIAAVLSVLLYVQGRVPLASIVLQTVPLSVLFALSITYSRYICRAMPLRVGTLTRLAAVHMPAAAVTGALWVGVAALAGWSLTTVSDGSMLGIGESGELAVVFAAGIATYLWSVTACYLRMAVEDAIRAENRATEAQCLALDAELKVLRAKLHPHFLFNSLNSIAALTAIDSSRAREMCINLAEFLRHSLSFSSKKEIRLSEELALVRAYLSVEKIRFSEKMSVEERMEPGLESCIVPPLLLQPLAENAVKHGVAQTDSNGWIAIDIRRVDDALKIEIKNATDPDAPPSDGSGHGLAIVRERVRNLFGDRARFTAALSKDDDSVFVAELVLPATKESAPWQINLPRH